MTNKTTAMRVLFSGLLTLTALALFTPTGYLKQLVQPAAVLRSSTAPATRQQAIENYGKLPLVFEENQGQANARVKFLSRGSGGTLYLTPTEAVLTLSQGNSRASTIEKYRTGHNAAELLKANASDKRRAESTTVRMNLIDANAQAEVAGIDKQAGTVNYFIGNDPKKWRTDVSTYARIQYTDVYRGVDLLYHGQQRQLEYDFIVKPGADPNQVRLRFDGAQKIRVDESGDLVLTTKAGEVRQHKPVIYQEVAGVRSPVSGGYVLKANREVSFKIDSYDSSQKLVIDPVLSYSTYLGGAAQDYGQGIDVDSAGNAYVTGITQSVDFPTAVPSQANNAGSSDAFVTKLNANGSLSYSTYFGGSAADSGFGIAVDPTGNACVTGTTSSANFPTLNAFQPNSGGGNGDAFVARLTPSGSLSYSTYLGGNAELEDVGFAVAVDFAGNAYVTGFTASTNFPVLNAFQPAHSSDSGDSDAFVTKLTTSGGLSYSTYLGGGAGDFGQGIAVDSSGNAFVAGWTLSKDFPTANAFQASHADDGGAYDAFVTRLNASGGALDYSTYLGGNGYDQGYGIAVDQDSNAYVVGNTAGSTDFPTLNAIQSVSGGSYDAFVSMFTANGALSYSTYLGGDDIDVGQSVAVDAKGNAYVTGITFSTNFPTLSGMQPASGGSDDAFFTKLSSNGTLSNSSYLGGSGSDQGYGIALDSVGGVYLTGLTSSSDFPTLNAVQGNYGGGPADAFVIKFDDASAPTPTPTPTPSPSPSPSASASPSPSPSPSPGIITLVANRDAFLRSGAENTNEGANERLRIRNLGDNRVVVGFDMRGISTQNLVSATLILNVAENAGNWGQNGRLIDARRLLSDWTEGNGRNAVTVGAAAFRGTGEGVTWRCAKDTNIGNDRCNCNHPWNGGTFASATALGFRQRNGAMGAVSWNVTADVLSGASFGWIIRKRAENEGGQVRYYSREGAVLAGHTDLAPRLVLVYRQ